MSYRDPSLVGLLVSTILGGLKTLFDVACVIVIVACMAMATALIEPDDVAHSCAVGSIAAVLTDCASR